MNSAGLRFDAKAKLLAKVEPQQRFLRKLVERCRQLGFPRDDALLLSAQKSLSAVSELVDVLAGKQPY